MPTQGSQPKRPTSPDHAWSGLLTLLLVCFAVTAHAASPAVEAALALKRTEPRHDIQTALALLDLGAQEEAARVAQDLLTRQADDQALADLVEAIGTARLSRLRRELPQTVGFVTRALEVASARAESPERLRSLVTQMGGERAQAIEAIRQLRQTGEAGVTFCLAEIATTEDPKTRARLREALVALDPISQPALFEATGSDNAAVRTEAAYALGRLAQLNRLRSGVASALVAEPALLGAPGDPAAEAARWAYQQLTGRTPSPNDVRAQLDAAVDDLLAGQILFAVDADRPAAAGPTPLAMQLAGRLARASYRINPVAPGAARRAAMLTLESGAPFDPSQHAVQLSDVLAESLRRGRYVAARRACELLGTRGDLGAVTAGGIKPAPLVDALDAPHLAVRIAAAEAILAINPQQPYAGSSRLVATLDYLAAGKGESLTAVAYPQFEKAAQTAGWLRAAGYDSEPANRGVDTVGSMTGSPDAQFALIDMSVSLPGAREVVFRLRRSPATALVPIAILASDGRLAEAERLAEEHGGEAGRVVAIPRPHSALATATLAQRLIALMPADWPDTDTRAAVAEASRQALAKLASEGPGFYALDRRASPVQP